MTKKILQPTKIPQPTQVDLDDLVEWILEARELCNKEEGAQAFVYPSGNISVRDADGRPMVYIEITGLNAGVKFHDATIVGKVRRPKRTYKDGKNDG